MWALLVSLASAACTAPTASTTVVRHIEAAELAFVDLDDVRLRAERDAAIQSTLCLGEVVHPPHAAALLRLEASFAFVNGNEAFAVEVFRSALSVQPNFPLKAAIAPPGGPLQAVYAQARSQPPSLWAIPPTQRLVFVNGVISGGVPTGLAVVQIAEPDGRLSWTGLVAGPQDLPPWLGTPVQGVPVPVPQHVPVPQPVPLPQPIAVLPIDPLTTDPLDPQAGRRNPAKVPLLAAAGVSLLGAGGLYAGSYVMSRRYDAAPTPARRAATNGMFFGSIGAGIVGVGLGTVALVLPGSSQKSSRSNAPDDEEGLVY